jgi:NAD(P)-dependent dehydrogenase (short-subunit alcohol dehydrogenase family)
LHLVEVLLHRGWEVAAGCRDPDDAGMLYALRPQVLSQLEVTDPDSITRFSAEVGRHCKGVDLVFNNAGVMHARGGRVAEGSAADRAANGPLEVLDAEALTTVYRVNTIGPVLVTQSLLGLLSRGSLVVNMSSRLGSLANTSARTYGYSASKAALNMCTGIMARELEGRGVACIAVSPGWVRTDMGGHEAPLDPSETAARLVDLAERLDRSVSGAFLDLDGQEIDW